MATVAAGPRPGRTPIRVPRKRRSGNKHVDGREGGLQTDPEAGEEFHTSISYPGSDDRNRIPKNTIKTITEDRAIPDGEEERNRPAKSLTGIGAQDHDDDNGDEETHARSSMPNRRIDPVIQATFPSANAPNGGPERRKEGPAGQYRSPPGEGPASWGSRPAHPHRRPDRLILCKVDRCKPQRNEQNTRQRSLDYGPVFARASPRRAQDPHRNGG